MSCVVYGGEDTGEPEMEAVGSPYFVSAEYGNSYMSRVVYGGEGTGEPERGEGAG